MAEGRYLFTSESVTMGHPDKVADQVSDAVLDAIYAQDPSSRVACETLVKTDFAMIAGEITTTAQVDYPEVVRKTIRRIGYTDEAIGFDADTCEIRSAIEKQSPDISMGVTEDEGLHKEMGAGDQGMMFGFACDHTPELMPMPIMLAHRLVGQLTDLRQDGTLPWLRPDGKTQVTVEYENDRPVRVHTVVISTQHDEKVTHDEIRESLIEQCAKAVIDPALIDDETIYHINPTGRFVVGGPHGDCGLTGRKIIVDTYGGWGRHGGGAFSGKDPSKVDRSAAYMARYVAKNVVAAGLAGSCEVQLAYAIGVADPLSVHVTLDGDAKIDAIKLAGLIREVFPLKPAGLIEHLKLRQPIFEQTAYNGHFGRSGPGFTWEQTDMADELRKAAGL